MSRFKPLEFGFQALLLASASICLGVYVFLESEFKPKNRPTSQSLAGEVTSLEGSLLRKQIRAPEFDALTSLSPVYDRESLLSGSKSSAEIRLRTGQVLILGADSLVVIDLSTSQGFRLIAGQAALGDSRKLELPLVARPERPALVGATLGMLEGDQKKGLRPLGPATDQGSRWLASLTAEERPQQKPALATSLHASDASSESRPAHESLAQTDPSQKSSVPIEEPSAQTLNPPQNLDPPSSDFLLTLIGSHLPEGLKLTWSHGGAGHLANSWAVLRKASGQQNIEVLGQLSSGSLATVVPFSHAQSGDEFQVLALSDAGATIIRSQIYRFSLEKPQQPRFIGFTPPAVRLGDNRGWETEPSRLNDDLLTLAWDAEGNPSRFILEIKNGTEEKVVKILPGSTRMIQASARFESSRVEVSLYAMNGPMGAGALMSGVSTAQLQLGDVNRDGETNALDLGKVITDLQSNLPAKGTWELGGFYLLNGHPTDVNWSGTVTIEDCLHVKRFVSTGDCPGSSK